MASIPTISEPKKAMSSPLILPTLDLADVQPAIPAVSAHPLKMFVHLSGRNPASLPGRRLAFSTWVPLPSELTRPIAEFEVVAPWGIIRAITEWREELDRRVLEHAVRVGALRAADAQGDPIRSWNDWPTA